MFIQRVLVVTNLKKSKFEEKSPKIMTKRVFLKKIAGFAGSARYFCGTPGVVAVV